MEFFTIWFRTSRSREIENQYQLSKSASKRVKNNRQNQHSKIRVHKRTVWWRWPVALGRQGQERRRYEVDVGRPEARQEARRQAGSSRRDRGRLFALRSSLFALRSFLFLFPLFLVLIFFFFFIFQSGGTAVPPCHFIGSAPE